MLSDPRSVANALAFGGIGLAAWVITTANVQNFFQEARSLYRRTVDAFTPAAAPYKSDRATEKPYFFSQAGAGTRA